MKNQGKSAFTVHLSRSLPHGTVLQYYGKSVL